MSTDSGTASSASERDESHGSKAVRIFGRIGVALGLFCAVVAMLIGTLLYTPFGNRFLGARIADLVSGAIPGRLELEALDHLGGLQFAARRVRFLPPNGGTEVIALDGVRVSGISFSPTSKRLVIEKASVESGQVNVIMEGERTTLEKTFSDAGPVSGQPLLIRLREINAKKTDLVMEIDGLNARIISIAGSLSLHREKGDPGVTLELAGVGGQHTRPKVLGIAYALRGISGKIRGGRDKVLTLEGAAHDEETRIPFRVLYRKNPRKVVVDIDREETSLAFDIATTLGDSFVLPDFVDLRFE